MKPNPFTSIIDNIVTPLRLKEVVLMSGFFVIGLVFARGVSLVSLIKLIETYLVIFFYILSVYTINSYSDYLLDSNNPRLQNVSKISRSAYFNMTIIFLLIAILLGCHLSPVSGGLVAFSFCLWLLYYLPPMQLKSTVLYGTIIHFIAGISHFHIGYCAVSSPGLPSLMISAYFSLLLCMGHLNHELIDYEADKINGIKNTTVMWGKARSLIILNALFVLSAIYWLLLYIAGIVNNVEFGCFFIPSVILIGYVFISKVHSNNSYLFQKYYRMVFVTGGFFLIIAKVAYATILKS